MGCCASTPDVDVPDVVPDDGQQQQQRNIDWRAEAPALRADEIAKLLLCVIPDLADGTTKEGFEEKAGYNIFSKGVYSKYAFFTVGTWCQSADVPMINRLPHYEYDLRQNFAWREHEQDYSRLHLYYYAVSDSEWPRWVIGPTPGGSDAMAVRATSGLQPESTSQVTALWA